MIYARYYGRVASPTGSRGLTTLAELGRARYLSLTTFRRDGTRATTPVWVVADGDRALLVWTGASTWKVKRLCRDQRVEVAVSTARGHELGPRVRGIATIHDETERVLGLLAQKYRVQFHALRIWGRISRLLARRPPSQSVTIAILLDQVDTIGGRETVPDRDA
jgi:PPOX class probable F420-dependent enzyme